MSVICQAEPVEPVSDHRQEHGDFILQTRRKCSSPGDSSSILFNYSVFYPADGTDSTTVRRRLRFVCQVPHTEFTPLGQLWTHFKGTTLVHPLHWWMFRAQKWQKIGLQPFLCLRSSHLAINQCEVCSGQCEKLLQAGAGVHPLWQPLLPNIEAQYGIWDWCKQTFNRTKPPAKPLQHLLWGIRLWISPIPPGNSLHCKPFITANTSRIFTLSPLILWVTESWECWNRLFLSFAHQTVSVLPVQGINRIVLSREVQSGIQGLFPGVLVGRALIPSAHIFCHSMMWIPWNSLRKMLRAFLSLPLAGKSQGWQIEQG